MKKIRDRAGFKDTTFHDTKHYACTHLSDKISTMALVLSLLPEVNRQLQHHGLMVKAAHGAIVDASFISCVARPDRVVDIDAQGEVSAESQSADNEHTAPANQSGQNHLLSALEKTDVTPERVYADKIQNLNNY